MVGSLFLRCLLPALLLGSCGALAGEAPTRGAPHHPADRLYHQLNPIPLTSITWAVDWARRRAGDHEIAQACLSPSPDGSPCPETWRRWSDVMTKARQLSSLEQLELVNAFWNRAHYRDPPRGSGIHLTSLDEALSGRGSFDCDDIAAAKIMTLEHLGWPADDLRLVAVLERGQRQLHAVATARLEAARLGAIRSGATRSETAIYVLDTAVGLRDADYMKGFQAVFWAFDMQNFHPQPDLDGGADRAPDLADGAGPGNTGKHGGG